MPITKGSFAGGAPEERAMPDAPKGDKVTIKGNKKGQKPITFQEGGLHQSLGVPPDKPIPPGKMAAAKAGKYGPKAQKQANFAGALAKMRPSKGGK